MFFKKTDIKEENNFIVKVCALLIHAAKIDENYTDKEEEIIKENSNQILDFTREIKNLPEKDKIKIVEALWSIIYSNEDADMYETNLMRRLAGLLYIDSKTMGDIKHRVKEENKE